WNDGFLWRDFNYAPVAVLIVILFATVMWFATGKKNFHSPAEDMEASSASLATEIGEPPKFPQAP
ncbi:MAG: hypothetical protein WCJ63_07140, partial [Actinomycetes bacterium]